MGRVRNVNTGRILAITKNKDTGWYIVSLRNKGVQKVLSLGTLVARVFLDPPQEPNMSLLHLDGDRSNCQRSNLQWRPRWYVIDYMRELKRPYASRSRPFRSSTTNQVFDNIVDFCKLTGEHPATVNNSIGGDMYFPFYGRLEDC